MCGTIKEKYMNPIRKKLLLACILLLTVSGTTRAENMLLRTGVMADPGARWRVAESGRFRYVFPAHLEEEVSIIMTEAEAVYEELVLWTGYRPGKPIVLLITDDSDLANGCVSSGNRGLYVRIFAVHPYSAQMGIDAYRDWYRHLLVHELTHYFHINQTGGMPALCRKVFGNLFYPNAATPRFYREGLAVYAETKFDSGFGRANSGFVDMYLRSAALSGDLPPLDRASSDIPLWPGSKTPYYFGVSFVDFLAVRYGEEKLHQFNELSGRYTCYLWSIPFGRVYGKPMRTVWAEWEHHEQLKWKGTERDSPFSPLTEPGTVQSFCFDRSGERIIYSVSFLDTIGGIYSYNFDTGKTKKIKSGVYGRNLRIDKRGELLYYIDEDVHKYVIIRNNIYVLNLRNGRERRLTRSGRIQAFDLAGDDGSIIACVSASPGSKTTTVRLFNPGRDETGGSGSIPDLLVDEPAVSPDGKTAAFSCRDDSGYRTLCTAPVGALRDGRLDVTRVTPPEMNAFSPFWLDGETLLFSGDGSGTYNLYTLHLPNGDIKRITDVGTGVFAPLAGPGGRLAVKEYTSSGYVVSALDADEMQKMDTGFEERRYIGRKLDGSPHRKGEPFQSERYRPSEWLLPGYWSPVWAGGPIGLGVGFYTQGYDLLRRHEYSLALVYDLFDRTPKTELQYAHNSHPVSWFCSLYAEQEETSSAPAGAIYPGITIPVLNRKHVATADLGIIAEEKCGGVNGYFFFSTVRRPPGWVGPQKGFFLSQGVFYNILEEDYLVFHDTLTAYFRPARFLLLNIFLRNKWTAGEGGTVYSGATSRYVYAPLEGVLTRGYYDAVPGNFVSNLRMSIGAPLLPVNSGIYGLPLFFKSINIKAYMDNGLIAATSSAYPFVLTEADSFRRDPARFIRSSLGAELLFDFVIGYELPATFIIGYAHTLSEGGQSGIYLSFATGGGF